MDIFNGVRNTFKNIDKVIGELRTGVTNYGTRVTNLTLFHNEILRHALEAEDSIFFLMNLNNFLFNEIEDVESQIQTQGGNLGDLNLTIAAQLESVQKLERELTRIKEQATQEAIAMQQYATGQMNTLEQLKAQLNGENMRLDASAGRLPQLLDRFKELKRSRSQQEAKLQQQLQARANLKGSLAELTDQRKQLHQYLEAVETLPLPENFGNIQPEDEVNRYFDSMDEDL